MKCIVMKFPKRFLMKDGDVLELLASTVSEITATGVKRKGESSFKTVDCEISIKEYGE